MDTLNVVEIPAFLENKIVKRITFSNGGMNIEKPFSFLPPVFIKSEDITAFRYGAKWTSGYKFVFGRQYFIETKDTKGSIFKFRLNSVYGIRRKTYSKVWSDMIDNLWAHYFKNILNYYTTLYNAHQHFEIAGVMVTPDGLIWDNGKLLFWNEISLSNYRTYFMIYTIANPKKNKSCTFSSDWNALILQVLLKGIIKNRSEAA